MTYENDDDGWDLEGQSGTNSFSNDHGTYSYNRNSSSQYLTSGYNSDDTQINGLDNGHSNQTALEQSLSGKYQLTDYDGNIHADGDNGSNRDTLSVNDFWTGTAGQGVSVTADTNITQGWNTDGGDYSTSSQWGPYDSAFTFAQTLPRRNTTS